MPAKIKKSGLIIRKAELHDIRAIYGIINPYSKEGIILKRTKKDIRRSIDTFLVAEHNKSILGTISYHDYGEHLKEIRSLAVAKEHFCKKIGSKLVKELIKSLRKKNNSRIFVLTYSPDFFIKNKFVKEPKEKFPEKIWKDCRMCRNSGDCAETALVYAK